MIRDLWLRFICIRECSMNIKNLFVGGCKSWRACQTAFFTSRKRTHTVDALRIFLPPHSATKPRKILPKFSHFPENLKINRNFFQNGYQKKRSNHFYVSGIAVESGRRARPKTARGQWRAERRGRSPTAAPPLSICP